MFKCKDLKHQAVADACQRMKDRPWLVLTCHWRCCCINYSTYATVDWRRNRLVVLLVEERTAMARKRKGRRFCSMSIIPNQCRLQEIATIGHARGRALAAHKSMGVIAAEDARSGGFCSSKNKGEWGERWLLLEREEGWGKWKLGQNIPFLIFFFLFSYFLFLIFFNNT